MNPLLLKDGYKTDHRRQYPEGTTTVYSNLTPRASRVEGVDKVVFFGLQYFCMEYLIRQFDEGFFDLSESDAVEPYRRCMDCYLGPGAISVDHIRELHQLGYLPLRIKAVPEGTRVPLRVPMLTIVNTHPRFFWLTNMLETILCNVLWMPCTSATTAYRYRRRFEDYCQKTAADFEMVKFQGHDFSFRGLAGLEAAQLSGAAHLLSFVGTDTIPAIGFLEQFYGANAEKEMVGCSVPATEHSVQCMGGEEGELATYHRLITEVYPTGIVSIVSDTWDFWGVLTEILPALKVEIMARSGKLVIRPDSGDPVKILCGDPDEPPGTPAHKGAVRVLWETFGGTETANGYRVLDSHVGLIYGDSITPERQLEILSKLRMAGFASTNVVLGIGSFTYQYVTRDTYGFAMKATYGEVDGRPVAIFKKPKTDSGLKNSAKGLLCVRRDDKGELKLIEDCTPVEEKGGVLETVFENGKLLRRETLASIRTRLHGSSTL